MGLQRRIKVAQIPDELARGARVEAAPLGDDVDRAGDDDVAVRHYEAALASSPADAPMRASALNNVGNVLHQAAGKHRGRIREAAERFERALQYDPHHLDALYNLGNAR